METKVCRKCNLEKPLSDYSIWSGRKSHRPDCKKCVSAKQRSYLKDNPHVYDKVKEQQTEKYWVKRNSELPELEKVVGKIKTCSKCGFTGDVSKFKVAKSNRPIPMDKKVLKGTCIPCANKREENWRKNNPDKMKVYYKNTYNRRKKDEEFQQERKEYQRNRLQTNPEYRKKKQERDRLNKQSPIGIWRRLLSNGLKQLKTVRPKQTRTLTLLGYTHETLFTIVGNKPEGNYHLDHSIPLSWMESHTPPSIACHTDNLTWISESDNLAKNNRYSNPVSINYFNMVKGYIKPNYISRFSIFDNIVYDNMKDFILEQWSKKESSIPIIK